MMGVTMEHDSPLALMGSDALGIQAQACRVIYLLRAIERLTEEVADCETKDGRLEVLDNIFAFIQIAEAAAKTAKELGESIEVRAMHMRRVGP